MSAQVGQEVKAVAGLEKGKVGTVLEIGSGAYEGFLKVLYPVWGDCWISGINGEEASWTEQEEVVVEEVQPVQEVAKVAEKKLSVNERKAIEADERRAFVNLERDRNIPASGGGITPKEAAYRLNLSVEHVLVMLAEGKFQSAYREESRAHEGLQDWISWKEVDAMKDHSKAVQPPDSFYH